MSDNATSEYFKQVVQDVETTYNAMKEAGKAWHDDGEIDAEMAYDYAIKDFERASKNLGRLVGKAKADGCLFMLLVPTTETPPPDWLKDDETTPGPHHIA